MARLSLIIAAFSALALTALSGCLLVPWLRKLKYGQTIKEIGPTWHKSKNGIPTMGGIMFYIGSLSGIALGYTSLVSAAPDLLKGNWTLENAKIIIIVATTVAFGLVGFVDDYIKIVKKRNLGLMARYKIVMQALITAAFMSSLHLNGLLTTHVTLPFFGVLNLGYAFYPLAFLLIIFLVNAANLTDGIDGLASSVTFIIMLGFMLICGLLGHTMIALVAAAFAGGCGGFLAWNFYPAKVFMGDTGSMFLGGAVVAIGFCMGRPELLLLLGFVYIIEAASVVLQVTYFKISKGKRIFKMSPIHHHFEMCGWSEIKIVSVFSLITFAFVMLACLYVYVQ